MPETENCLLKALTFFLIQIGKLPVTPHKKASEKKKASVSNITQNGQSKDLAIPSRPHHTV